jgi:hypothetical protein
MTCPITVRLGVYALGAADTAERVLIESHLATCQACRTELAYLEPLPGLLTRVPASLLRADTEPARNTRAWKTRSWAGAWRWVAGVTAAATLAAVAGFWLGQPAASRPAVNSPPAITLSGANPVTHVHVNLTLTGTSWGSSIRLQAWGLPLNQPCRLIVRSRAGGVEVAGAWDAWRAGPISVPASAAWRPADIASLQVATMARNLVTVAVVRLGAHSPG